MITFEPVDRWTNPLMGWVSSEDPAYIPITNMVFNSADQAVKYAELQGLEYSVVSDNKKSTKTKSYSENFKWKGLPKTD